MLSRHQGNLRPWGIFLQVVTYVPANTKSSTHCTIAAKLKIDLFSNVISSHQIFTGKRGLDLCLNLGCARERSSVPKIGLKGKVWPYSPGPVDPVRRGFARVYSGPKAGRYDQTRTAIAVSRCPASELEYQGGAVSQGPGPSGGVPGKAVPRPEGVPKGPGGAVQASGPGGVVPPGPGGGVPAQGPGGAVPRTRWRRTRPSTRRS